MRIIFIKIIINNNDDNSINNNNNNNNNDNNDISIGSNTEIIFRIIHKILRLLYYTLYSKYYFHLFPLQGNNSFLIMLLSQFLNCNIIITCSFQPLRSI